MRYLSEKMDARTPKKGQLSIAKSVQSSERMLFPGLKKDNAQREKKKADFYKCSSTEAKKQANILNRTQEMSLSNAGLLLLSLVGRRNGSRPRGSGRHLRDPSRSELVLLENIRVRCAILQWGHRESVIHEIALS